MFLPPLYDNIGILVNHPLYLLVVICLDALFLKQFKLSTIPNELCHTAITLYMYVEGFVLFTIKEERKSIEPKYFWHASSILYITPMQI